MHNTALQPKQIYTIVGVGRDCDGFRRSNNCLSVYYSKTVAQRVADGANEFSEGILSVVVSTEDASQYAQSGNPCFSYVGI